MCCGRWSEKMKSEKYDEFVQTLAQDQREIFQLGVIRKLSVPRIAKQLHCQEYTVERTVLNLQMQYYMWLKDKAGK
jgi:uncharacterized protein (DUF488 family)